MSKFTRIQVAQTMKQNGMVPVFFHKDIEVCKKVLKACYDGGARVFEFTNRGDRAHMVFQDLIIWAEKETPK
jgi:2-dehydro-3-deoxyphosphogluconate aldolase/(4S)-4-hydroxy-2-oxoglutarate aldolase